MVAALITDSRRVIELASMARTKMSTHGTGSVTVNSVRVQARSDEAGFSHLICECSDFQRLSWCEHTSSLYLEKDRSTSSLFSPAMAIVIFARKPTLVIPVVVLDSDEVRGLREVSALWGNPRRAANDSFAFDGHEGIGYLDSTKTHRGEIRTMILEWLPAVVDVYAKDIKCTGTGHFGVTPNDTKMQYADAYCRLDGNLCYQCRENLILSV